ncbi:doxorubicin biosynthesis protein DnrV [Streptomyces spongiicola]|uniref:Doxorubicin biosynthesis protein DnrV n=1 Tax=Streptomyces spongiicola TaxID=1690221 RepID=A0A388ST45_9ACTN|nr:doxorubicin biosynthesis protein DnrV [Streptomyces spongiicola]
MASTSPGVPGTPCWVSLATRDMRAAQDFYGAVFGWGFGPDRRTEGHVVAHADGEPVAGLVESAQSMGVRLPVAWTAYFVADSADAAAARVRERGGTVAVGPLAFGRGRTAWAADPLDAAFGIWEGPAAPGWQAGRGTGAVAWLELHTRDPFASALFYGGVFEWDAHPDVIDVRYEHDRVMLRAGGRTVAGMYGGVPDSADAAIHPRWHVHFCRDDVDAAAARAAAAHGTVVAPPRDTPLGRTATILDPEGGLFHLSSVEGETS